MSDNPTLWVCHGDDEGPRVHPCRRVQEALRAKATVGEVCNALRDVWGVYVPPDAF